MNPQERISIPFYIAFCLLIAVLYFMQVGSINNGNVMIAGNLTDREWNTLLHETAGQRTGYHTAAAPYINPDIETWLQPTATPDPHAQYYRPLIEERPLRVLIFESTQYPKDVVSWLP